MLLEMLDKMGALIVLLALLYQACIKYVYQKHLHSHLFSLREFDYVNFNGITGLTVLKLHQELLMVWDLQCKPVVLDAGSNNLTD